MHARRVHFLYLQVKNIAQNKGRVLAFLGVKRGGGLHFSKSNSRKIENFFDFVSQKHICDCIKYRNPHRRKDL